MLCRRLLLIAEPTISWDGSFCSILLRCRARAFDAQSTKTKVNLIDDMVILVDLDNSENLPVAGKGGGKFSSTVTAAFY